MIFRLSRLVVVAIAIVPMGCATSSGEDLRMNVEKSNKAEFSIAANLYCASIPKEVYAECYSLAKRIREDKDFEWEVFQSLNLPLDVKKARDEARKYYNNAVLVSEDEISQLAKQTIVPRFKETYMAGRVNMNEYFCNASVNNQKYGKYLDEVQIFEACLHDIDMLSAQ